MKKLTAIICVAAVLLCASFAACSQQAPPPETPPATVPQAPESPPQPPVKTDLNIFAAASLQKSFEEIAGLYSVKYPNDNIIFNFAGSGTLVNQIAQGSPCDAFVSASVEQMDKLFAENGIKDGTRTDLFKNRLVLVCPIDEDGITGLDSLKDLKASELAIGTPETVPAGKYTKNMLENLGLWSGVEKSVVYAKDVSEVRAYVETGNVRAGFVYYSDAASSDKVKIVQIFTEDECEPVIYPGCVTADVSNIEGANNFLEFLKDPDSVKILEAAGFEVIK